MFKVPIIDNINSVTYIQREINNIIYWARSFDNILEKL